MKSQMRWWVVLFSIVGSLNAVGASKRTGSGKDESLKRTGSGKDESKRTGSGKDESGKGSPSISAVAKGAATENPKLTHLPLSAPRVNDSLVVIDSVRVAQ